MVLMVTRWQIEWSKNCTDSSMNGVSCALVSVSVSIHKRARRLGAKRHCHTLHASLENAKREEGTKKAFSIRAFCCEGMRGGQIPCAFEHTRDASICM